MSFALYYCLAVSLYVCCVLLTLCHDHHHRCRPRQVQAAAAAPLVVKNNRGCGDCNLKNH
jgi:hypothetical protein